MILSFEKYIHPCNYHPNPETEHIHDLRMFSYTHQLSS